MIGGRHARRLAKDPVAFAAACTLVFVGLVALLGPILVESSGRASLGDRFIAPVWSGGDWSHPLGTDALGRDMLGRLVAGTRVSLLVGLSVVTIAGVVGTLLGIVAGYRGATIDVVVMRIVDAQLAFPGLVLILAIVGALGPSIPVIIIVLSVYAWMIFARLTRGITAQLKSGGFVRAAEMMGCSWARIVSRHILPAIGGPLLTQAMLELGRIMLAEASLSFLGLGVQPPDVSWGLMISENRVYLSTAWWTVVFPGLALAMCVLTINVLAGWLRVQLDPEQRQAVASRRLRRRRPREVKEARA